MSATRPLIIGIGGTTRAGSSSERCLVAALSHAQALGAATRLFGGEALDALPHFNPAQPGESAIRDALTEAVRACDGLIVATPGYHGSVSGLVKNALDSLEGLREDVRPYFDGRAVGLIVTADGAQAGGTTLSALRGIVHAMRGWPTPYGAALNGLGGLFETDGTWKDPRNGVQIETVAAQVVAFADRWG